MRSVVFLASLGLSAVVMAGCSSTSGIDSLGLDSLKPSKEITSSILPRPDTPVVAGAAAPRADRDAQRRSRGLADAGMPPVTPSALIGTRQAKGAIVAQRVALARPDKAAAMGGPQVQRHRFRDAKPIDFGKVSPKDYAVHGVDVSRWQGRIDWNTLRSQGANFVYIKATDGGDHLDPMFMKNWHNSP